MRGSHAQHGELESATREANFGKVAAGDQSMRGSQSDAGGLESSTREANFGKVAAGDQSMRGSQPNAGLRHRSAYGNSSTPKRLAISAVTMKQTKVSSAHQSNDHQKPVPLCSNQGMRRNMGRVGMTYQNV